MGQPLQTKTAIQSKTVRLNLLSIVSIILNALLNDPSFTELVGGFIVMILNGTLIGIRIFDTDTKIDGIVKPKQSTDIRDEHEKILKDAEDAYFPNDSP